MNADAYFIRGNKNSADNNYEKAIADLTEAIRINPTCAKYYYQRANNYIIKNQQEAAINDYTKAIQLGPIQGDNDIWNFTLYEAYRLRAHAYRSLLRYDFSITDFSEAIRLGSGKIYDYRDRSVTYKLMGNFEKALQDVAIMQKIDPNNSVSLEILAVIYEAQEDKSSMAAIYDEQIFRFGTPIAYYNRGRMRKSDGDLSGAIADFEAAISQFEDFTEAYVLLAKTLLDVKEFIRAINIISDVIDNKPDFRAIGFLIRGYAQRGLGKMDAAQEDFMACISNNTDMIMHHPNRYSSLYIVRGEAYSALQQVADAVSDYRIALDIEPNIPEAASLREYVEKHE